DFHVTGVQTCALPILEPERTAEMIARYPDLIVGIKNAHFSRPGWDAADRSVEAGRLSNRPVMIDFTPRPDRSYQDLILKHLRPRSEERRVGKERRSGW